MGTELHQSTNAECPWNRIAEGDQEADAENAVSKFGYETGKTYQYTYKSEVVTHIVGADTEQSKLNVQALAHVEVLSQCEMRLKLTDVELTDSHPERPTTKTNVERAWEFKRTLQQNALRFAFQDGRVEAVCPEQGEETWALNVKRAVLSGLQNTMHDLGTYTRNKESDVSGECYVDYSVKSTWTGYKITKAKDILSCSGHAHYDPFLQTTKFDSNSRIQSLPLMKTTHRCEQTINSQKIISAVTCRETHVFRPFSTETSGATTQVIFSLEHLETVRSTTPQGPVAEHKSLVFEYEPTPEHTENRRGVVEVKTAISTLCGQVATVVDPEAPATFAQLVQKLRELTPEQLEAAHTQIKANPPCTRAEGFFHDAIPVLGTPASARLIRVLLTSGEMSTSEADQWLTSMSFVARPTRALLADVKELLVQNISFRKATLAVTSLVNNYCHLYADCGDHQEVRDIIAILDKSLGYNCAFRTKQEYNKVMTALKGIGNAGHAERVVPKLNRCLLNTNLPAELRVTAVTAFRRMACTADRDDLARVFGDVREDSELRLAAYLGLMACPTRDILNKVNTLLGAEQVNQVGSFVWTHLTNLQTTSSPLKQDIRRILENEVLKKTFNMDQRKFSRNIEWSTFSESLNAGVTVDSNLIWSPKSFLPRSASLNLTIDMFGESLNLVEVGGRSEGIDGMLEKLFGPSKDVDNHIPNAGPRRRWNSNKPTNMDPLQQRFGLERDTPKGSYYLRMFGNEIKFDDFQEFDYSGLGNKLEQAQLKLEQFMSKRHNFDHTSSGVLFDVAMVVPTVAGLPLRLRADGTTVTSVHVQGKFDMRRALEKRIDIEGAIKPSAAVQINAEMSVDAMMARSGVRMVNTIRSNSVLAGKLEVRPGGIFNLDLNMPEDNVQLFDATSKFFIEYRNAPREQTMLTEGRLEKRMCTDTGITKLTGLQLCARLSAPHAYKKASAPFYPLTGPTSISIVLSKKDTYRGLHFETKFAKEQVTGVTGTKDIIKVQFLTPGSRIDREIKFEYVLDNPNQQVTLNIKTPWKTLEFTSSVINTNEHKQLKATAELGDDTYDLLARCDVTKNKFNTQFRPIVEVTVPGRPVYKLGGSARYRAGKKLELNMRMENVLQGPLTIRGSIDYIKRLSEYKGAVDLASSVFDAKVQGAVVYPNRREAKSDLNVEYQKTGETKHTLQHKLEWKLTSITPKFEFEVKSDLTSSQWSAYNSDIDLSVAADSNAGSLNLLGGLTGSDKRLTLRSTYAKDFRKSGKTGEAALSVVLPYMNWDTSGQGTFEIGDRLFKAELQRRCHTAVSKLNIHFAHQSLKPFNSLMEVSLITPGRQHVFKDTIIESSPGTYDHKLAIDVSSDYQIRVDTTLKRLPRPEFTADISIPNIKKIKAEAFVTLDVTDFSSSAKVEYGRDVYSTAGSWKITKVRSTLSADAKFDLVYPARTITAKADLTASRKMTQYELELKWDAKKDASKRFMLKIDASTDSKAPRINMRSEWHPAKFLDVTISGKNDKKGWYHPERDLEAKFVLLSSFENARQVSSSFTHVTTNTKVITQSEISWGTNMKIATIMTAIKRNGWQDALITVTHTTPFDTMRSAKFLTDYSIRGITYDLKHRLDWDGKFVELSMTSKGDLSKHDIEGGVTLLTSYPGYSRMAMTGKHTDNGRIFKSQFQGTWRDGSSMTMALNANHERTGWYVTNSGDISISIPVGPYRNNKLTWNHKNTANLFKTHTEMELDNEKSVWDLDSTFTETSTVWAFDVKTTFNSPYPHLKNLALNIKHKHNPQNCEGGSTGLLIKWASGKEITIVNRYDIRSRELFRNTYELTTPFPKYRKMSTFVENKYIGNKLEIKREFTWGSKKTTFDGYVMLTFPETSGEFRLVTPYEILDRLLLTFENKKVNGIWLSSGRFDYPGDNKVEMSTQIGWENKKKFNLEIKTPCPHLELLFIDFDHTGPADNFKTKMQVEHNMMGGRAVLSLESDVSNLEDIKVQLGFASPYEQVAFIRTGFTHKKTRKTYNTKYTFEYPAYKAIVSNELVLKSLTDFDEKFTIEYADEKIETGLKFKFSPLFKVAAFLKTPFEGYTSTIFNLQLDKRQNIVASTDLTYGNSNRLAANMDYRNVNGKITGSMAVSTPFAGYEASSLNFNHQGRWNNFKNGGALIVGGRTFEATGEFLYRSSKLKVGGTLKTPYESYRTISLAFDHEGEPLDMKHEMEIVYGENTIKITHEFKFKNNRLNHKLQIVTPFSTMSSLRWEVKHNGPWKNFRNQGTLEYNGRTYSGNTQFMYGKKAIRGSITVNTPDTYSVRFNHKGENNDFTNNIVADLNGQSYSSNTQFTLKNLNLEVSTNVRTPHSQMRVMSVSFTHRGPINNFQNSFSLNINDNTYTGQAQLKLNRNDFAGSAEFKLPKVYSLIVAHKGGLRQFENSIDVTIDTTKYEAASNFGNTNEAITGSLSVKIPQEYSITFSHTGSSMNFANDFTLKYGAKQATGNTKFVYAVNDLTVSVELVLPLKGYEKFKAEIKHKGDANRFKTEGLMELPFKKVKQMKFGVDHTANLPEFNTKAVIGYNKRSYGLGLSHEGNSNDFTTKAGIVWGPKKIETEVKWTQTGMFPTINHTGSIHIVTPYRHLISAETKFRHSIRNTAYSGQVESLYNSEKYFDTEYTFSNEEKKEFTFTIREPHSAFVNANFERTANSLDASTTVNWDTTDSDSNVKVVVSAKTKPKYEFELQVIQPRCTSVFKTDLEMRENLFSHGTTVQWGQGPSKRVVYQMTARKSSTRRNNIYSGDFELRSPYQNVEARLQHEQKTTSVKTVFEIGNIQKLTIIHDFQMREPDFRNFQSDLIVKHPELQQDIKLKFSGLFFKPRSLGGGLFKSYYGETRLNLLFANEEIIFESKLGDASNPEETKYIAWAKLNYPRVNIDTQALVQAGTKGQTVTGKIKLDHLAALDGQWKSVQLMSTLNKEDKTMDIEFKSPYNEDLYLRSNLVAGPQTGVYNVDMTGQMGTRRIKAALALDKNAPRMDFKLDYKPDHQFHMYAKYLSLSTAQFEAYRRVPGAKIIDTQFAVRLNNSRILHARAYFRPEVVSEIKTCMASDHGIQTFLNDLSLAVRNDVNRRMRMMEVRFQALTNFLQTLSGHLDASFSKVRDAYNRAYSRDQFYLQTSHRFVKHNHAAISEFATAQYNAYKPLMDAHFEQLGANWVQFKAAMAEKERNAHAEFVTVATDAYNYMVTVTNDCNERVNTWLNAPWFGAIAEKYAAYKKGWDSWYNNTINSINTHPYVKPVLRWFSAIPQSEYLAPVRDFHAQTQAHLARLGARYKAAYAQAYAQAAENFNTEEMRRIQEWYQDRINDGKKAYQYFGLADAEKYVRGMSASSLDDLKNKGVTALKNYLKLEKTRITVWDPARGDFQAEMYLPVRLHNIRDFPVDEARRLLTRMRHAVARLTPDDDWVPWDTIYAYKPTSTNPLDWIPPFKSHATMAGSQHFMTFDRTFYEFAGECSYVLAHDFMDGNFSVIVNYDMVDSRMSKKSITVLSNNKEIEIFPSFKVTVDSKQTELPIEFEQTSVVRQGNRIRLDNSNGVTVSCDLAYDRCTVNVTGWYFAKTAGMMGTYNNEPYDDLLTAERRIVTRPELLAESWTVGSKCRAVNNAQVSRPETMSTIEPICAKYFKDQTSLFRMCFRQVEVAPFMTMCLNDLSARANQVVGEADLCQVSAFYVDECNRAGVPLRQLRACVSCQLTNGQSFSERSDQKLENADVPQSADVVLVVSQKSCNSHVIPKLQKLLITLEDTLVTKGLRRNQYGVVGFGGDGAHASPHSHTIEGQLFNRNFKVGKMIGDLRIATDDSGKEAAIDALDLAARYPFRAGVSKTIVLLTCETCSENIVTYADMVELLLKRDIKLHLMTPHDFRMKSNSPKASNIWGMTRYTVYTNKHANNLNGDVTLRRQTYMPKDLCGALSHETEGAIFNAKKFGDRKIKDFRTVVASVMANVATPSDCQVCECMPDETGVGQPVCHSCNLREPLYALLPKFDGYMDTFDIPALTPDVPKKTSKARSRTPRRRTRSSRKD